MLKADNPDIRNMAAKVLVNAKEHYKKGVEFNDEGKTKVAFRQLNIAAKLAKKLIGKHIKNLVKTMVLILTLLTLKLKRPKKKF